MQTLEYSYFAVLISASKNSIIYYVPHLGIVKEEKKKFLRKWFGVSVLLNVGNHLKIENGYLLNIYCSILNQLKYYTIAFYLIFILILYHVSHYFIKFGEISILISFFTLKLSIGLFVVYYLFDKSVNMKMGRRSSRHRVVVSLKENHFQWVLILYSFFGMGIAMVDCVQIHTFLTVDKTIAVVILIASILLEGVYIKDSRRLDSRTMILTLLLVLNLLFYYIFTNIFPISNDLHIVTSLYATVIFSLLLLCFYSLAWKNLAENRKLKWTDAHREEILEPLLFEKHIGNYLEQGIPFLQLTSGLGIEIKLLLRPYGSSSAELFLQVLKYSIIKGASLSVIFIGNLQDALYAQFAGFIKCAYDNTTLDLFVGNLTWWFLNPNQNFADFKDRFAITDTSDDYLLWNKWRNNIGLECPCVIASDYVLPAFPQVSDVISSLDIFSGRTSNE
jgi:hypothetical protein